MTDDDFSAEGSAHRARPDTDTAEPGSPVRSGVLSSKRVLGAVAFAAIAFVIAAVFGVLWWTTISSDEYRIADARDDVTTVAREGIEIFTEIDHTDPDRHADRKREIATGDFYQAWEQDWESLRENIVASEISVRSRALDVAVNELNAHEGSAGAIAVIEVSESPVGTLLWRLHTRLERQDGDWKLSELVLWPSPLSP